MTHVGNRIVLTAGALLLTGVLAAAAAAAPAEAPADSAAVSTPRVVRIVVGTDVDRDTREPVGVADAFKADVGRLVCFTRIVGAAAPTEITHVWYRDGETLSRVPLTVGSADWRTWSSKRLLPSWTGHWEVKVLDSEGLVLGATAFTVAAPDSAESGGE